MGKGIKELYGQGCNQQTLDRDEWQKRKEKKKKNSIEQWTTISWERTYVADLDHSKESLS